MEVHSKWSQANSISATLCGPGRQPAAENSSADSPIGGTASVRVNRWQGPSVRLGPDGAHARKPSVGSTFFVLHGSLASGTRFAYGSLRKGQITVLRAAVDDDAVLELALNAGAANAAFGHPSHEHRLIASTVAAKRLPTEG